MKKVCLNYFLLMNRNIFLRVHYNSSDFSLYQKVTLTDKSYKFFLIYKTLNRVKNSFTVFEVE